MSATATSRPAWSVPREGAAPVSWPVELAGLVTRDWAWGGSTGAGVRVCVLDSGVEPDHPRVGRLDAAFAVEADGGIAAEGEPVDVSGHGTACAGIIRELAPECELVSVRVLGAGARGNGSVLLAGLRFAIESGFDVVNMSLSTSKPESAAVLRELVDGAYFRRTVVVASAHNMPVESYPWKFASVLSVGSHGGDDPFEFFYNTRPPVEFFGRGIDVDVAWRGGGSIRASGNSFATPQIAGLAALVLAKHPGLTPFQLKSVLSLTASNVVERSES